MMGTDSAITRTGEVEYCVWPDCWADWVRVDDLYLVHPSHVVNFLKRILVKEVYMKNKEQEHVDNPIQALMRQVLRKIIAEKEREEQQAASI